jgi:hypothetical protein
MVYLCILASTPLHGSEEGRLYRTIPSLHSGHSVHEIHTLVFLGLIAAFAHSLAGPELCFRGRIDE